MITKICNALMSLVIIVLILIAGILFVPKFIGYENFAVISGSMEPKIPVGSIVYSKSTDFNNIDVGDVITFRTGNNIVTHRVVEIDMDKQEFITKGDANNVNDGSPVKYKNVIGKVGFTIPLLGYITINIKTPLGIAMICAVIFVILLLNYIPEIIEENKENK